MTASEVLHAYKSLLRAIDRNITSITGNRQWRDFVIAEFRRHKADTDPVQVQQQLQEARDYAFLINGVREHKELLLSYNIGIPVDLREKEMNQRAANLVGLAIPPKGS